MPGHWWNSNPSKQSAKSETCGSGVKSALGNTQVQHALVEHALPDSDCFADSGQNGLSDRSLAGEHQDPGSSRIQLVVILANLPSWRLRPTAPCECSTVRLGEPSFE